MIRSKKKKKKQFLRNNRPGENWKKLSKKYKILSGNRIKSSGKVLGPVRFPVTKLTLLPLILLIYSKRYQYVHINVSA